LNYEWDPAKDASNFAKHGIDFISAVYVFSDPDCVITDTTRPQYREMRYKAIGRMEDGQLIAVIFTDRMTNDAPVRRIISARKVRKNERANYQRNRNDTG
jgi:uncharacterized DUF497 family protein